MSDFRGHLYKSRATYRDGVRRLARHGHPAMFHLRLYGHYVARINFGWLGFDSARLHASYCLVFLAYDCWPVYSPATCVTVLYACTRLTDLYLAALNQRAALARRDYYKK